MLFLLITLTSLICCLFRLFHNKKICLRIWRKTTIYFTAMCDISLKRTLSYLLYGISDVSLNWLNRIAMTDANVTLTPNTRQVWGYSHISGRNKKTDITIWLYILHTIIHPHLKPQITLGWGLLKLFVIHQVAINLSGRIYSLLLVQSGLLL